VEGRGKEGVRQRGRKKAPSIPPRGKKRQRGVRQRGGKVVADVR